MKVEPGNYLKSRTEEVVINCGNNSQLYKLVTLCAMLESIFHSGKWMNINGNVWKSFSEVVNEYTQKNQLFINQEVFENGIECEILDTNFKSWKKGKFRAKLVLEFIPDEPEPSQYESPLDEIRREIESGKLS